MGSLVERRLRQLEDFSREHAVGELRRAWASLSDKEAAVLLIPYATWLEESGEPTEEEGRIREEAAATMPEELIARAIGFEGDMDQQEIDHRMRDLAEKLEVFKRGPGIRRHMLALEGVMNSLRSGLLMRKTGDGQLIAPI